MSCGGHRDRQVQRHSTGKNLQVKSKDIIFYLGQLFME